MPVDVPAFQQSPELHVALGEFVIQFVDFRQDGLNFLFRVVVQDPETLACGCRRHSARRSTDFRQCRCLEQEAFETDPDLGVHVDESETETDFFIGAHLRLQPGDLCLQLRNGLFVGSERKRDLGSQFQEDVISGRPPRTRQTS